MYIYLSTSSVGLLSIRLVNQRIVFLGLNLVSVDCDFWIFRLLDVDDEPNANEYPLQVFKHRGKRLRCRVCDVYTAR